MSLDVRRFRAFGFEQEDASGPDRDTPGPMTVPRAINPASNPLAAPVRGRHPLHLHDLKRLREAAVAFAWLSAAAAAVVGWLALVYAAGA